MSVVVVCVCWESGMFEGVCGCERKRGKDVCEEAKGGAIGPTYVDYCSLSWDA